MTEGEKIRLEVRGLPVPQGALQIGMNRKGRAFLFHRGSGPLQDWRRAIASAAQPVAPPDLWSGPVSVTVWFDLPRPKGEPTHAGRGKARHPIRTYPDRRPDLDKLVRAVLDALTNVIFRDDSQVVRLQAYKDWGVPGARIEVEKGP